MKNLVLFVLCSGIASAFLQAQQEPDPLAEHIAFYVSFDDSLEPDQARGEAKIQVGNFTPAKYRFMEGVRGKAVIPVPGKAQNLRFKIKDNINFAEPGSITFWFNPVDWAVQTADTPNQPGTQWKKTYHAGFFGTSYSANGYIVLQRLSSHVPGGKDVLMLLFPCFKDLRRSGVSRNFDFGKNVWHFLAMTWNGLDYSVCLDGKQVLSTAVPYKLTQEKLSDCFELSMAGGLAFDEFTVYDKQLSPDEVMKLYRRDAPSQKRKEK